MRVLHICSKTPFPPIDGGTIASYQLANAMLKLGWQVKNISVVTPKHPKQEMPIDPVYQGTNPAFTYIDTTPTSQGVFSGYLKKNNYLVSRFFSAKMAKLITDTLEEDSYDIVLFDGLFTTIYLDTIKEKFQGKTIVRSHNVEFHLWEDRYVSEESGLKRFFLRSMIQELKNYELNVLPKFDEIACISETDKAFFNSHFGLNRSQYLPFGIEPPSAEGQTEKETNVIRFLGALDWEPNIEGLNWFLNEVWPTVHQRNPKIVFEIGGRNAPEGYLANPPEGVKMVGLVDDAYQFISSAELAVVPLLSGSGIRIKIVEALFAGQIVVTTSKGAQGVNYRNEKELFVTDNAKTMSRNILDIVGNKELQIRVGEEAKKLANKSFHINNTVQVLKSWQ